MKTTVLIITVIAGLALTVPLVRADDPAVPAGGFPASRYETLWTKSPFAVATVEAAAESPDYMLVGIAGPWDGISYASLIERQSQEHFLISSDKPTRGITLTSITRGHNGSDTYAVVQKDGQPLTLKLEQPPAAAPGATPVNTMGMPGIVTPQISMPGANIPSAVGRPFLPRIHRPTIHLPPPQSQQAPAPPPPPSQ